MTLSMDEKLYDFEATITHETEFALLVKVEGEDIWFPKKVIQNNKDGTFTVPMDWAEDKGLV